MTSHMKKKKVKRYQEGGEAEDKKRGLAASNKEGSVGFFERLRMGNIDDPKSEAYKRFGAGRGQTETDQGKGSNQSLTRIGQSEPSDFGSFSDSAPAHLLRSCVEQLRPQLKLQPSLLNQRS
jgi:hypothetical protein